MNSKPIYIKWSTVCYYVLYVGCRLCIVCQSDKCSLYMHDATPGSIILVVICAWSWMCHERDSSSNSRRSGVPECIILHMCFYWQCATNTLLWKDKSEAIADTSAESIQITSSYKLDWIRNHSKLVNSKIVSCL